MVAQFIDVSSVQGTIDFVTYCAWARQWDGKARIAIKASEGVGFVDPLLAKNRTNAIAAGIDSIYYYHFARPDLGNSALAEANFMQSVVGQVRESDLLVLDFEVDAIQATGEWAYAWLQTQESNYSKLPRIYASTAYIQQRLRYAPLARYPLWLADWEYSADEHPAAPFPWTTYDFVQYSDRTSVPGIPGLVDADLFFGEETTIMPISLATPRVSNYFKATGDPAIWQCIRAGFSFTVGHGILSFYQKFGGDALCGLTYLGLPLCGEIGIKNHPGSVYQEFERGIVVWNPDHSYDFPPGSGPVYLAHRDAKF